MTNKRDELKRYDFITLDIESLGLSSKSVVPEVGIGIHSLTYREGWSSPHLDSSFEMYLLDTYYQDSARLIDSTTVEFHMNQWAGSEYYELRMRTLGISEEDLIPEGSTVEDIMRIYEDIRCNIIKPPSYLHEDKMIVQFTSLTILETILKHRIGDKDVWINGCSFDPILLKDLLGELPWKYSQERDVRTIYRTLQNLRPESYQRLRDKPSTHVSVNDCMWNSKVVKELYGIFWGSKF